MKYLKTYKPKVYDDIQIYPLYKNKEGCIGTIQGDSFIKVKNGTAHDILALLKLMNGDRDINDLNKIIIDLGVKIDIETLIDKCIEAGLLENANKKKKTEIARLVKTIFTIKFNKKQKLFDFFKYLPELCLCSFSIIFVYCIFLVKNNGFSWKELVTADIKISNMLVYYLGMIAFMFVHEFFHLCEMRRYKLLDLEFSIGLHFYIFPVFYVKGKGMYTLSKWERIHILLAGVVANFCLMVIFLWIYFLTEYHIYIELSFFNLQSILINLMPFALRDGYYIMANLLNKVNLREKYLVSIAEFPKNKLFIQYDLTEKIYVIAAFVSLVLFCFYQARNVLVFLRINTKYTLIVFVVILSISIISIKLKYKVVI